MTLLTGLRKTSGGVVRIQGTLIILHMTGDARSAGEVVAVVDVAVGTLAGRYRVPASKREASRRVIELRAEPVVRSVAKRATGRKSGMAWTGILEIR